MPQPCRISKTVLDPTTAMNKALAFIGIKHSKSITIPNKHQPKEVINPQPIVNCKQAMNMGAKTSKWQIVLTMLESVNNIVVQYDAVGGGGGGGVEGQNEVGQNAVHNPGIQNVENMNGLSVVPEIANQYGNGNVVTAPAEGNGNGINGNPIRCYNCRGEGHYASNCTVKPRKRDAAYLQQQLQIAQEEEAGIQSTQVECEFMAAADAYEETERVKCELTLEDKLQQASLSGTQSDNAPVYDSDGSTKKLEDEKVSLESQVLNYAKENAHLKTTYKNLFDSIKVTQAQTNSIIDSLQKQLYDTIYDNAKLRAQLFDKVSERKGTTKGTRTNTMFTKQSILGKPPSSSYKPKLYFVTPFPKSSVLPKVDKTNALSKPVTSNSAPSTRESKGVQTVKVIASRIFRTNHSKTSRVDNVVPNKPVKSSVRTKPITASQPNVIHRQQATLLKCCLSEYFEKLEENHRNSLIPKTQKHKSSECNNIKLAVRNAKSEVVCAMFPDKKVPSNNLQSSNTENKSDKSVCDNASTSNPSKPSSKGFSNSTSLLGRQQPDLQRKGKYNNPIFKEKGSVRFSALYLKKKRNLLVFTSANLIVMTSSFAVTTADAFDKCQQQQDSTSSTSTLAITITAEGNFDLGFVGGIVPLLPAMLAGAAMDQGEGSAQPAEPHHTPVDPIPSTSQPPHSPLPSPPHPSPQHPSPPHSPLHHSSYQSPPHSPHHSPPQSSPYFSPPRSYKAPVPEGNTSGSAEDSVQLKELMVLVAKLVTRINSLEKELKDTKQTLGNDVLKLVKKVKTLETALKRKSKKVLISELEGEESEDQGRKFQDIDDDPLVSLVRESVKEKPTDFVTPTKSSGEAHEEEISPTILEAAKTLSKNSTQRFTSTDGESIESYYHRFSKLMNDFKRNKHFPEKIASNLKFLNNLQPEWSRHVTIVHQTKDLHTADYTQLYDFFKYNQKEVMIKELNDFAKTHDPLAQNANSNNPFNYPVVFTKITITKQIAQPVQNVGNQVVQNAVQNQGVQNVGNQNGIIVVPGITNQNPNRNGNVVAARAEGNATGEKWDAAYLQTQLCDCIKEEAGIHLQAEEFDLMVDVVDLDEIEEVNANCILMVNLQQASTSDPPAVHDSEETLQLAQESRLKMKQLNKEIKPANYTKINHLSGVFVSQTAKSQEEVYFLNTSKTATVSKSISIPNEEFLDDTTPSVARKFLNEVKSTIVTLQRVVKHRMTLDTHNWSSIAHQEIHKILKEENFPIINQVDTRLQNFEIQFLKEAAKFVRDFKSLAKEADESLAKHKALELEIERLLRAVVRVDNTAKTRRPQPRSNTKNDRVPSASKSSCIKNKEVEVEEHPRNLLLSKNKKHMSSELKINPKEYFDSVASLTKHLLSEHLNKMEYGTKKSDRALCYPKNDREDIGKLGAKGDIVFSIVILLIPVLTDTKPGLQSKTLDTSVSRGLDLTYAPSTITTQQPAKRELDLLFRSDV
ncbi:retrovirus-related pol polyprotein from transposon TNT 1-94 [Tanacetum coccineum]